MQGGAVFIKLASGIGFCEIQAQSQTDPGVQS